MSRDDGITYICYKCGEKLKHRNMITIKNNDYVRNFDDFLKERKLIVGIFRCIYVKNVLKNYIKC